MNEQTLPPASTDTLTAVVMTNEIGQVVFVESRFLTLMGHSEAEIIIGEPLHKALGCTLKTGNQLLQELQQTGQLSQQVLELQGSGGTPVRVLCTGLATYDHLGMFIGADLSLRWTTVASVVETQVASQAVTTNTVDMALLEDYFLAQVQGIEAFMVLLGGQRVRDTLETMVNGTAEQNRWTVKMLDGLVKTEVRTTETSLNRQAEIYAALMTKVVLYAVRIAGGKRLVQEIQAIEAKTDAQAQALAHQMGLQQIVTAYLN